METKRLETLKMQFQQPSQQCLKTQKHRTGLREMYVTSHLIYYGTARLTSMSPIRKPTLRCCRNCSTASQGAATQKGKWCRTTAAAAPLVTPTRMLKGT